MAGEPERIGSKAREATEANGARIVISAVNIWEVAIKRRLGKLDAPPDLLERLERAGLDLLPVTARHADRVGEMPMHHRDPFDRLLIAQAEIEGHVLITADGWLADYGVEILWQ